MKTLATLFVISLAASVIVSAITLFVVAYRMPD